MAINDLFLVTIWWLTFFVIGSIFIPFTIGLFKNFFDKGYIFSKVIGMVFVSYVVFILGIFHIAPFTLLTILAVAFIFLIINLVLFKRNFLGSVKQKWHIFLFEEIIFFIGILFWSFVRAHNPDIHGLEKFMDFGFINSALRSEYFPPQDMWLAGHPINYYYFGHIWAAVITKLSAIPSAISYNLILATIFALAVIQTFTICFELSRRLFPNQTLRSLMIGFMGSFIVNLGGNLHTIYALTLGYQTDNPVPFWKIQAKYTWSQVLDIPQFLSRLSEGYWYPNATRFIPYTIHEFPIYSYVVADLHGHVFDIPFVLLTIAVLISLFLRTNPAEKQIPVRSFSSLLLAKYHLPTIILLGFLTSVHYMTNAFDGPIYLFLTTIILWYLFRFSRRFFMAIFVLIITFIVFNFPFSYGFRPFVTGIGVNCAPSFLSSLGKVGPFIFEKNCQASPLWMLAILWGFFWTNFAFFLFFITKIRKKKINDHAPYVISLIFFTLGSFLITIPEFFYIKDIYPAHFRANTMFKLGYQAFIIMGIASTITFAIAKKNLSKYECFWTTSYFRSPRRLIF